MQLNTPHYNVIAPLLKEVGGILLDSFGKIEAISHKSQSPVDAVTELDGKVETIMAEKLRDYDSSIGFYGEEHGGNNETNRYWLVDPLDGTAHFIRGNPFCTTMISLIESGQVTFAAIYDFVRDDLFAAAKNEGAFCNDKPIRVSERPLKKAYFAYEVDFQSKENLSKWLEVQKHCITMNTINCGFEFSRIASGRLEGRLCLNAFGKDWDYAPGSLLVAEAGGIVRNIGSNTYDFQDHNFIATTQEIDSELRALNLF